MTSERVLDSPDTNTGVVITAFSCWSQRKKNELCLHPNISEKHTTCWQRLVISSHHYTRGGTDTTVTTITSKTRTVLVLLNEYYFRCSIYGRHCFIAGILTDRPPTQKVLLTYYDMFITILE